jgi:pilus assembly protein Flp/PilA
LVRIGISGATRKDAKLKRIFVKFQTDETGATAIEYCLIAAFIALAIIAIVNGLGINLADELAQINNSLK